MKGSIMTNQALINENKSSSEKELTNIRRRTLIGGALVALLPSPERVMAQGKVLDRRREDNSEPKDPLVLLLSGPYHPVVAGTGPDLHLQGAGVDLNDGSYSVTQIFPVHVEGIPCRAHAYTPISKIYVHAEDSTCA